MVAEESFAQSVQNSIRLRRLYEVAIGASPTTDSFADLIRAIEKRALVSPVTNSLGGHVTSLATQLGLTTDPASPTGNALARLASVIERMGPIDAAASPTGATNAKLNEILARIGAEGEAASMTGALHGKLEQLYAELASGVYGLPALKGYVDGVEADLAHGTYGLAALNTDIDSIGSIVTAIQAELASGTYGLAAIKAYVDTLETEMASVKAYVDTLETESASIKAYVDTLEAEAATIKAYVDNLEERLTSGRAANLDKLDANVSGALVPNKGFFNLGTTLACTTSYQTVLSSVSGPGKLKRFRMTNQNGGVTNIRIKFTVDGVAYYASPGSTTNTAYYLKYFPKATSEEVLAGIWGTQDADEVELTFRSSLVIEIRQDGGAGNVSYEYKGSCS